MEINATNKFQAVSVGRLEVGMYVVELDVPWRETPFQYEGFEILSISEIEVLQRHCSMVFIDPNFVSTVATERSRVIARESASALVESERLRLLSLLSEHAPHAYSSSRKSRNGAAEATEAFNFARTATERLFSAISSGKPVEARHCRGVVEPLVKCTLDNPDVMARLTFINKHEPQRHDRRISTAVWASIYARYLGLAPPTVLDVASGALLLDLGFNKIAPALRDHDGHFVERERLAMQSHVKLGYEMLGKIANITERVRHMQREHHERLDGSGYPRRLRADAISAWGSFAGIVDCYDAMISDTPYRSAMSSAAAITELSKLADSHFPRLHLQCFVQSLGMFPSGSIVELNTGEIAIVMEQDERHRLRPIVLIVCTEKKVMVERPYKVRLSTLERSAGHDAAVWIDRGHPVGTYGVYPQRFFE